MYSHHQLGLVFHDSYAAAAVKDESAASSERVDSGLENASISQAPNSEPHTESGSDTRASMFANFKKFDIVSDPSDHHYVTETAQVEDFSSLANVMSH